MTKKLLSSVKIQQLISLRGIFACVSDLKVKNPLAAHIQYPKLPPRLTESLAIHLLRKGETKELGRNELQFGENASQSQGRKIEHWT